MFSFVLKRLKKAKSIKDPKKRELFEDHQARCTLDYLFNLAEKVVQSSPFFKEKFPNHIWVRQHKLFSHEAFGAWSCLMKNFTELMTELDTRIPRILSKATEVTFEASLEGKLLTVTPVLKSGTKIGHEDTFNLFSTIVKGLTTRIDCETNRNPLTIQVAFLAISDVALKGHGFIFQGVKVLKRRRMLDWRSKHICSPSEIKDNVMM